MPGKRVTASSLATVFLWALAATAPAISATNPEYLAQWPDVERVLADQRGPDEADTWARQVAALHQLDRAIEDMADERRWNQLTADELALRGRYREASGAIRQQANARLSSELGPGFHWPWEEAPRQAWYSRQWEYESDPDFRHATLSRYLSPPLLAELDARKSASDQRGQAAGRQMLRELGYRESRWSAIGSAGQSAVASAIGLLLLPLLLLLVRELRRFGLDPDDPQLLRAGFARFRLEFLTGVVDRNESEGGGRHARFDLWVGYAWHLGFDGAYVAIPHGHLATAVSARRRTRRRKGHDSVDLLFVDHDAKSVRPIEQTMQRLLSPSPWWPLPTAILAAIVGSVSDPVPGMPPLVGALLFAVIAWLLAAGLMRWAGRRRTRRFLERDAPRIADAATRLAVHPGPPPPRDADGRVLRASPAAEPTVADPQLQAAVREVTASLMPSIPAIGKDGNPLRAHVWTEPYFSGFVLAYAVAALRRMTGSPQVPDAAINAVAAQAAVGMARSRGVADPLAARRDHDGAEAGKQRLSGVRAAQLVLGCFAGDAEALAHPVAKEEREPTLRVGSVVADPPATSLHPDGPHAPTARRLLGYLFSEQLVELSGQSG